jgi:6-phosphogluconolactonase
MSEIVWAESGDDEAVADHVAAALAQGGTAAVPGGRTSPPILRLLAVRPLPWERIAFTLTDDREVSIEHQASNFRLLNECLGATGASIIRFAPVWEGFRFRLVWVGMGADGHVASLFPSCDIATEAPPDLVRVRPVPLPPEAPFQRVTLTYAALANADEVIVVLRGEEKKALLEAAATGMNDLPIARLLRAANSPVTVFWSPQ